MRTRTIRDRIDNTEEIIDSKQLEKILDASAQTVSGWCKKACLKPKKDKAGNIYFSKNDVDVLKKVKELYEHSYSISETKKQKVDKVVKQLNEKQLKKTSLVKQIDVSKGNFLTSAKSRFDKENAVAAYTSSQVLDVNSRLDSLEHNIVAKISNVLAEKMDGLDEVVVELIRSKTENETLRQRLNELNKENFSLKAQNASYKSLGLGLYIKKDTEDFIL